MTTGPLFRQSGLPTNISSAVAAIGSLRELVDPVARDDRRVTASVCSDPLGLEGVRFAAHSVTVAKGVALRVLEWNPPAVDRAPVVFVAGLITITESWAPVLRDLAATRRVVYVETREKGSAGISRDRMNNETFTLVEMGRDITAVCHEIGVDCSRAVFVGSSLGANAILEALKQGLECKAAFLIGPNAEFSIPWWGRLVIRFPAWAYRVVLPPVLWYLRHFRLDPEREPEQAARYERSLAEAHPGRLKLTLRGLLDHHILDGLESVEARVAVAFAGSDMLHGEESVRRLVGALPEGVAIVCSSNAAMHSPAILEALDEFEGDTSMRRRRLLVWALVLFATHGVSAASRSVAPEPARIEAGGDPGPGCEDGVVLDDGSFETAYGWVPSAEWGEYVQTFHLGAAYPVALESVCVCWTRTRDDDSLDFELEVYEDVEGMPADEPLIVVRSSMSEVPAWTEGCFTEVPVGHDAPPLMPGIYHIGVRWGPSVDQFFFVCADQSNPEAPVPGFFRDDRAEGEWEGVLETSDPMFADHTAMLIRVRGREVRATPAIGSAGAGILILLTLLFGWWRLTK